MKRKIGIIFIIAILALALFTQNSVYAYRIEQIADDIWQIESDDSFSLNLQVIGEGEYEVYTDWDYLWFTKNIDRPYYNQVTRWCSRNGHDSLLEKELPFYIRTMPAEGYRVKSLRLEKLDKYGAPVIMEELVNPYGSNSEIEWTYDNWSRNGDSTFVFYNIDVIKKMEGGETTLTVEFEKIETNTQKENYKFIKNENGTYNKDTDEFYSVRIDAEYSKFESVEVDGTIVDSNNYTVESGSTIVTFSKEYMNTLSEGEHTLAINFSDGVANTNFTIAKELEQLPTTEPSSNPTTAPSSDPSSEPVQSTSTPENLASQKKPENSNIPKTGDEIYIAITLLLAIVIGNIIYYKRKNH